MEGYYNHIKTKYMFDPKKEMSFEDLKSFFSATYEWKVETTDTPDTYQITFDPDEGRGVCSHHIYQPNIQRVIRTIRALCFNHAVKNFD